MKDISNKITNMKKNLKGIATKYIPFYNKQTVQEENMEKSSESNYGRTYEDREVNQGSMGLPGL